MEHNEKTFSSQSNFHLAGIIPVAGQPLDFELPYPDVMLPVSKGYTMIEAAVVEAAHAGCNTIWIVCNDDTSPLLRYRIGDYIQDPLHFYNKYQNHMKDRRIRIPIFWVPVSPKDRDKRDCLSWSVIHGAVTALKISDKISKWLIPDKYYVSFPYGIFDPRPISKLRKVIKSKSNFYVRHHGLTVKDNQFTSFTFGKDEFVKYRRNIRKGTGAYSTEVRDHRGIPRSKLPIEERWSARHFDLQDVFCGLGSEAAEHYDVNDFFNLGSWDLYTKYTSSLLCKNTKRPSKDLFRYREFNSLAKDRD